MLPTADLQTLVSLFYPEPAELGRFEDVPVQAMPVDYRELLAHTSHMTVSVEEYHRGPVDVRVLDRWITSTHYARKILLARQRDGRVVQYGIMRVNFDYLSPRVRAEIQAERTPLGRLLIQHDVMRRVRLAGLWRVAPGPELCRLLELAEPRTTFGRTAMIECNGEPAIELLEIVAPLE
ncbi:MAG TPA: hypothetical protein VHZ24_06330 [Pirellulales bacterium]|jgi:uncharacterized protein (DUF2236 family)|nr:hypothetical protein [Pirellulales bacterium]